MPHGVGSTSRRNCLAKSGKHCLSGLNLSGRRFGRRSITVWGNVGHGALERDRHVTGAGRNGRFSYGDMVKLWSREDHDQR